MDSTGIFQGIFNQSTLNVDVGDFIIAGLTDNKVVGAAYNHLTTDNVTTDWLTEGPTNQYFTTTRARAAFSAGTGVSIAAGVIAIGQAVETTSSVQFAGLTLGTLSGILKATAGLITGSATTDDLTEGKTNLYFTTARAQGAFSAGTGVSIAAGVIAIGQAVETTSSPQFARLLNSSIGSANQLIGEEAGKNYTGNYSVIIGHQAGQATNSSSGFVAIGYQSLFNCTGAYNTALGSTSGINVTTGSNNVLVGNSTGRGATPLTTGSYNVLLGAGASTSSSTSNYEIVIGYGTGAGSNTAKIYASNGLYVSNLTAGVLKSSAAGLITSNATTDDLTEGKTNLYFTTARAQGALSAGTNITITSGVISTTSNPTFSAGATIGTLTITSMNSNISNGLSLGSSAGIAGGYNVYLGHQAGTSATGNYNTAVGFQALAGATGSNSFGLGFAAGYNMQTSGNVCIGSSTGQNLLTGSGYNIYIGSGVPSSTSASYEIVIGGSPAGITGKGNSTCFISAGSGLYVSNLTNGILKSTAGKIEQAGSGDYVQSITGTANQINVTGTGAITLSTPQDIATSSSPQFARLSNSSIGTNNLLLGTLSGSSLTTGTGVVAIGDSALSLLTTGIQCTAIGYQALRDNNGNNNTAVGYRAGLAVTTGFQNTLLGTGAGRNITTGNYNNLFGMSAGLNMTTATYNMAMGVNAGFAITTGSHNIALGNYAMGSLNTATSATGQNVAIGNYAHYNINTTATNNVAIGYNALYAGTTATNNTIIGSNSATALATGSNNTVIGHNSLNSNILGSNNTIIGYNSGKIIQGTDNIHIGVGCQASILNVSSEIIIAGTSGTTIGKGAGTCYISSPYGLYSYNPVIAQFTFINSNPQIAVNANYLPYYSYSISGTGSVPYFNRGITITMNLNSTIGGYWQFQQLGIYKITVSMKQLTQTTSKTTFIGKTPTLGSASITNLGTTSWTTYNNVEYIGWNITTLITVTNLTDYYFISEYFGIAVNSWMNNNASVLIEYISVG